LPTFPIAMVARSKSSGTLCVGLVTIPFSLEPVRRDQAPAFLPRELPRVSDASAAGRRSGQLEVVEFVPAKTVDPRVIVGSQWIVPSAGSERALSLFIHALLRSDRVGVGRFSIRDRDVLVVVQPFAGGLLVHECVSAEDLRTPAEHAHEASPRLRSLELELADTLVATMSKDAFDPLSVQGVLDASHVAVRPQIVDLLEALKRSVHAAEISRSDAPPPSVAKGPKKAGPREALEAKGRRKRAAAR
jgi:non-homologous end joining protein Ku